jgi:hypothetical protein
VAATRVFNTRRLLISVVLAAATGLLFVGLSGISTKSAASLPRGIDAIVPNASTLDLRQARIGVDLSDRYDGALQLDRIELPDTEVERVVGLNQIFYTPGRGKVTGALSPGRHCATAIYWLASQSRAEAASYSWCFNVH